MGSDLVCFANRSGGITIKILAPDLGKFKSVSCCFDTLPAGQRSCWPLAVAPQAIPIATRRGSVQPVLYVMPRRRAASHFVPSFRAARHDGSNA